MDDLSLIKQTWQKALTKYQKPQRDKSIGQLLNTLIPFKRTEMGKVMNRPQEWPVTA